ASRFDAVGPREPRAIVPAGMERERSAALRRRRGHPAGHGRDRIRGRWQAGAGRGPGLVPRSWLREVVPIPRGIPARSGRTVVEGPRSRGGRGTGAGLRGVVLLPAGLARGVPSRRRQWAGPPLRLHPTSTRRLSGGRSSRDRRDPRVVSLARAVLPHVQDAAGGGVCAAASGRSTRVKRGISPREAWLRMVRVAGEQGYTRRLSGGIRLVQQRLAIHGGAPVRPSLLPYGRHEIDDDDVLAVTEALRSGWITTGPRVAAFESAVADLAGARHAVAFSSGTAALHAAAFAAGLGPGDEAVTTPLTFCATANCVLYQGATPVFADVSPDTLNLDPDRLAERLTSRTKAILAVDFTGHPADLDAIRDLADRHGAVLIEDACHALGARYRGRPVGSISRMTVFSFHPVKHVTTGEGGMVTTDDAGLAGRLRTFRNHGLDSDANQREARGQWRYDMVSLGYNYRLADLGCALGSSQLRKLPANLARRRQIAQRYTTALAS